MQKDGEIKTITSFQVANNNLNISDFYNLTLYYKLLYTLFYKKKCYV